MSNRIERNMRLEDYLAAPGINKHALDWLLKSPQHFKLWRDGEISSDDDARHNIYGRCLHALILDGRAMWTVRPDTYQSEKGETKAWNGNSNVCKAWLSDHSGEDVLTADEAQAIEDTAEAVRADKFASELMAGGVSEVSMFAQDWKYDAILKSRPDRANLERGVFVDLKTTTDASTDGFSREIAKRRYHLQAGICRRAAVQLGIPWTGYYYVIIEKGPRPFVNVRKLGDAALNCGESIFEEAMERLEACEASGVWPGYSGDGEKPGIIDIPTWAYHADEEPVTIGGKSAF